MVECVSCVGVCVLWWSVCPVVECVSRVGVCAAWWSVCVMCHSEHQARTLLCAHARYPLCSSVLMLKPSVGEMVLMSSPLNFLRMVVFPALSRPLHAQG